MNNQSFDQLMNERPEELIESTRPFLELMAQYRCALLEVQTKFEVLNTELSLDSEHNPFESISCRIKKPISIIEKLRRKNLDLTLKNIEEHIHDVAGIRIICSFPQDIYILADKICSQDDIRLIEKKDYILNPKPNGYRSLHLILEIPVFLSSGKKMMQVEVQLRTLAMDLWASIEHKVRYKKEADENTELIVEELRQCAEGIHQMDLRMQEISRKIEWHNNLMKAEEEKTE